MASGLHPELETYTMETTLATGPRISSEKLGDRCSKTFPFLVMMLSSPISTSQPPETLFCNATDRWGPKRTARTLPFPSSGFLFYTRAQNRAPSTSRAKTLFRRAASSPTHRRRCPRRHQQRQGRAAPRNA
jgi:hypothetical protein